ncbi:MAG: hypothetical protein U9O54_06030 [Chloroflexota bacterium]|nr:hypothetical protein [Chloroflexota bacterium]
MSIEREHLPAPPKVLGALQTGFDSITRHVSLVLFPLGLDLFIWFAPHLRIKHYIEQFIVEINALPALTSPELKDAMQLGQEVWLLIAERFNIFVTIRSYPVGIFSLMSSLLPMKNPVGEPVFVEFSSLGAALLVGVLLTVVGIVLGALYFSSVVQVALHDEVRWRELLHDWPRASGQTLLLTLAWAIIFICVAIFGGCLISGVALFSASMGQATILLYVTLMTWLLFPLFFSAHGIFVNKENAWRSLLRGAQLANLTFIKTGLFVLTLVLLVQGLNMLWQISPEDSWLMLVSISGHAFISTGALAASFVYYQDMAQWAQKMLALQKEHIEQEEQ